MKLGQHGRYSASKHIIVRDFRVKINLLIRIEFLSYWRCSLGSGRRLAGLGSELKLEVEHYYSLQKVYFGFLFAMLLILLVQTYMPGSCSQIIKLKLK